MLRKPRITLSLLALGLISSALISQRGQATPIEGTIGFFGFGSVSIGATNTVTFNNPIHTFYGNGDYAGVPSGTLATFQSISFTGAGGSVSLTNPVTPLWTLSVEPTIYSFDLTSLSSAYITYGGVSSLTLAGSGAAYISGFSPTIGTFAIQGTGANLSFQFVSASTTANGTAVPDSGTTVALLGLAFVAIVGLHRRIATV